MHDAPSFKEIIEKVENRLRDGTGRAGFVKKVFNTESFVCSYLDQNNNRCAVGIFMPTLDEAEKNPLIKEALEYKDCIEALIVRFKAGVCYPEWFKNPDVCRLLTSLQVLHDADSNWDGNVLSKHGERKLARIKEIWLES